MFSLIPKKHENDKYRSHGQLAERPFGGLAQLRDEFDGLFQRFWSEWPQVPALMKQLGNQWGMHWEDKDDHYLLRVEAPDFEVGEFDIQIRGPQLVISAEHRVDEKQEKGSRHMRGSFYQSIALPPGVEQDKVQAKYRNGVLEVSLPKDPNARGKRIEVKPN